MGIKWKKVGDKLEKLPERKILRLSDYDYSQAGYYFITLCTKNKKNIFGEIVGVDDPVHPPVIQPNQLGNIVFDCWKQINEVYDYIKTDAFCLMPNHIHGIIVIEEVIDDTNASGRQGRLPLPKVIQGFKSVTTRMCFPFGHRTIWQRNYYEHVIRNELELQEIRKYIVNNPLKWQYDKYFV